MTDCNTSSSNISGTPIAGTITQVGSNLEISNVVQTNHGFTVGNVIRFDVGSNGYTLSQADSPANAEVCGVVSSAGDVNVFNYVVEGDINTSAFSGNGVVYGATAAEVFFLSSATAGALDSVPPNDAGTVLKAILVRTPTLLDGSGITQDKALVKNYVGNYLGGDTAVYMSGVNPVGSVHAFAGAESKIPAGWALCNGQAISSTTYPDYNTTMDGRYGFRDTLTFDVSTRGAATYVKQGTNYWAKIISGAGTKDVVVEYEVLEDATDLEDSVRGDNETSAQKQNTTVAINGYIANDTTNTVIFYLTRDGIEVGTALVPTAVTRDSTLTPDLRNKFIFGATGDSTTLSGLNETGGYTKIDLNSEQETETGVNRGISDSTFTAISNMPPYVTLNWIIRIGDSSYTALLNQLSLKTLSLTELPTSDSGLAVGSVYNDGGVLKIVT